MSSFNSVVLVGNLTREVETKFVPSGTAVSNFSIAINRKFKQGEETKESVDFFDIVCFGKVAESCGKYLNKGSSVLVSGRLSQRRWEADDGQKRSKVEIVAQNVVFMGGKKSDSASSAGRVEPLPEVSDEVPF